MRENKYDKISGMFKDMGSHIVTIRRSTYKGRGRPKKSDYVKLRMCDVFDFRLSEMFACGFSTTYVK